MFFNTQVSTPDFFKTTLGVPAQSASNTVTLNPSPYQPGKKIKEAALNAQKKKEAEELAEKLSKFSCTVTVEVNDLDKLYGSVTEADVAKALEVEGFSIDKKAIVLEKTIDELGIYDVGVKLYPEVTAKIRLWVAKK